MKIGRRFSPPNAIKWINLNGYRRLTHLRCSATVVFLCAAANLGVTKRPVTALRHLVDLLDFTIFSPPFFLLLLDVMNPVVYLLELFVSLYKWPTQFPRNSYCCFTCFIAKKSPYSSAMLWVVTKA